VLCAGGKIVAAGPEREILRHPWLKKSKRKLRELDCQRRVVLPGLVDCHTHPAFMAPRLVDFEKRIAGSTYEEIATAGGGIRSSLTAVRSASRKQLSEKVQVSLEAMLTHGTSTVEAKSGYGLTANDELKSLRAVHDAVLSWPGTVVPTLLAAHVVPPEFADKPEVYVDLICDELIPTVARRKLAQSVDAFCERGAFTLDQTERIFAAAARNGLETRAHVCQFTTTSLKELLAYKPASLDHLECLASGDLAPLAKSETVAVLLPGANYFLGHRQYPDARKLIESGVALALATDYNPGTSPTPALPFIMSLACTHMKMTPAEAISCCTINAACALRLQVSKGSIEPGKDADLAVFDVSDYREIAYWFAWNRCAEMVVAGEVQDLAAKAKAAANERE
jgi:imidazolonepropionase